MTVHWGKIIFDTNFCWDATLWALQMQFAQQVSSLARGVVSANDREDG
jgi:hypothetical protein